MRVAIEYVGRGMAGKGGVSFVGGGIGGTIGILAIGRKTGEGEGAGAGAGAGAGVTLLSRSISLDDLMRIVCKPCCRRMGDILPKLSLCGSEASRSTSLSLE